jgi:hypothetical protein
MQPLMNLKFKTKRMKWLSRVPLELILWIVALTLLGSAAPVDHNYGHHFTFCPLANLGIQWCPGCGLGRSITHVLHGNVSESLRYHWLGIPAVLIIGYRIVTLSRLTRRNQKN